MSTKSEAIKAISTLRPFIGEDQLSVMIQGCKGEEQQFFIDKIVEMAAVVQSMPKTYEQDGKGEQAVAYLHYFTGGCDWYITEKDVETEDEPGQFQAFGIANLGYGPELGYISIVELLENHAELDLHFTPKTIGEIKAGKEVCQ